MRGCIFESLGAGFRPAGRVSFWVPRKKPKRHQGAAQDERFALIFAAPGPQFYGGRQCGGVGGQRKGAGGHGIGFRSITAAAEKPVTFGRCFSWLEARLLGWWGSSSAQGTAYPGVSLGARRGGTLGRPYSGQRTASKSAPSSAPFGGTFPLKGGRLDGKGPLIRLAFGQPPSPQGEGLGRSRIRAGSVGGETQAQKLNRTRGKFCALRARWPG